MISSSLNKAVSAQVASAANMNNNIIIMAKEVTYLFDSLRKIYEWHLVARRVFAFHNAKYVLQHNQIYT